MHVCMGVVPNYAHLSWLHNKTGPDSRESEQCYYLITVQGTHTLLSSLVVLELKQCFLHIQLMNGRQLHTKTERYNPYSVTHPGVIALHLSVITVYSKTTAV